MFIRSVAAAVALCLSAITAFANPPAPGTIASGITKVLFCHMAEDARALGQAFRRDVDEGALMYHQMKAMQACGKIETLKPAMIEHVEKIGVSSTADFQIWLIEISDPDGLLPNIWLIYGESIAAAPTSLTPTPGREA